MLLAACVLTATFLAPTVRMDDGRRVSLHGRGGPPVVFSGGLFGTMPHHIYSDLFRRMRSNLTLVVLEDVAPVTAPAISSIADALAVDRVAFLAHSSFDAAILDSDRVESAVLCDPVVLPTVDVLRGGGLRSWTRSGDFPVRVLRAGLANSPGERSNIPAFLSPDVGAIGDRVFPGMGHADLLDDRWAEMGRTLIPWMSGAENPTVPFRKWSFGAKDTVKGMRDEYRQSVADEVVGHVLRGSELPCLA